MPPEQVKKAPEEIVLNTGWGFLVSGSTQRQTANPEDLKPEEQRVSPDNPIPSPPPQIDH